MSGIAKKSAPGGKATAARTRTALSQSRPARFMGADSTDKLPQPQGLRTKLAGLPARIRALRAWLLWRYEPNSDPAKPPDKVPHYLAGPRRTGDNGSPADRAALASFADALAAYEAQPGHWAGLGLAALPDNGLVIVDVDCKASTSKPLLPGEVAELCVGTYAEVSPGGVGRHVFLAGQVDRNARNHQRGVEVFCSAGWVTVTGNAVEGQPAEVAPLDKGRREQLRRYVTSRDDRPAAPQTLKPPLGLSSTDIAQVLDHLPVAHADDYYPWLDAGMAVHHETRGSAEGLATWERWSQRSPNKYQDGACAEKWKSFGKVGRDPMTMRTMVWRAEQSGWRAPATVERAVRDFHDRASLPAGQLDIIDADTVSMRNVDWLWFGRLPKRFISVFASDTGCGKSTTAAAIAAVVTGAGRWPDGSPNPPEPAVVLWLGIEDPLGEMTVPRLTAAGADKKRVKFLNGVNVEGPQGSRSFSLQDDLALLREWLQRMRVAGTSVGLIVVDPVTAYLHGRRRIDPHKATELREVLTPFAQLAEQEDLAIVCITHLTKSKERGFLDSVLGSGALIQLSRNVWGFGRVPGETDNSLAMFFGKTNIAPQGVPTLRFHVEGTQVTDLDTGELVATSRIVWDGVDPTVTKETMYGPGTRGPMPYARQGVAAWLREYLADGEWHSSAVVQDAAIEAGHSIATLVRARKDVCDVESHRGGGRMRLKS